MREKINEKRVSTTYTPRICNTFYRSQICKSERTARTPFLVSFMFYLPASAVSYKLQSKVRLGQAVPGYISETGLDTHYTTPAPTSMYETQFVILRKYVIILYTFFIYLGRVLNICDHKPAKAVFVVSRTRVYTKNQYVMNDHII